MQISPLLSQLLSRRAQDIAFCNPSTPTPEDLFGHQANVLLGLGLSSEQELNLAGKHLPRSGPFLFVPADRPSDTNMRNMMGLVARTYGMATTRIDLKHPVCNVVGVPTGAYFITGYDETLDPDKASAAEIEVLFNCRGRLPLTALEVGFRLMYGPHALEDKQFGSVGSHIERGQQKEWHVPVFQLCRDTETLRIILGSFLSEHHSSHTLFPSCTERVGIASNRTH